MTNAIDTLMNAIGHAMSIRPRVGGFPVLAEVLRQAGVTSNLWYLPSCQSIYITKEGNVVSQGTPLLTGQVDIPEFKQVDLIKAIRIDQAGDSSFPEFLQAAWSAGVVSYAVDFEKRTVIYYGVMGEFYLEAYPAIEIDL